MERQQLSKKTRFEIFKRDGFVCQYCGGYPPDVVLEVDHLDPVANGGTNNIDNLYTSCFECNRGKGCRDINILPESTKQKSEQLQEREDQYLEYKKLRTSIDKRIKKEVNEIEKIFQSYFEDFYLLPKFKNGSLKSFISKLGYFEVEEAMSIACGVMKNNDSATKYFCGICWRKIRQIEENKIVE
jgi:hypothetical protein